jgi:hypothetical protein
VDGAKSLFHPGCTDNRRFDRKKDATANHDVSRRLLPKAILPTSLLLQHVHEPVSECGDSSGELFLLGHVEDVVRVSFILGRSFRRQRHPRPTIYADLVSVENPEGVLSSSARYSLDIRCYTSHACVRRQVAQLGIGLPLEYWLISVFWGHFIVPLGGLFPTSTDNC